MIPQNIIEDVRYRNDVVDVISSYVTLKKAGKNMKGLCPFHSEKTPSFTVYEDTQSFYCFGCGAGGDVISFIMRQENLDYVSAVDFLAKRVGITLPSFDSAEKDDSTGRARVLQMNLEAAKFFREMLFDDKVGADARRYIIDNRGLDSKIVKRFGIGYAPRGSQLRDHLRKLGFTDKEMVDASLCGKGDNGVYDFFRERVMFPVIDISGNIIAFGGRTLGASNRKYINSSDTPAFKKNKNLFALNFAKNNCADRLIVCEGYMDAIAMYAHGIEYAVATLGTAMTSEHARIIKKYTSKVILAYDSDEAGQKAANRAFGILGEAGIDARVLVVENAKDPDEYLKKFGAENFNRLLDGSRSRFDYFLDNLAKKYNVESDEDRIRISGEICNFISEIYSRVEREIYITRAAKFLGIEKQSVAADVELAIKKRERSRKKESTGEYIRITSGLSDRVNRDYAKSPKKARLEEEIIGLLVTEPAFYKIKVDSEQISENDFSTDFNKRLFSFMKPYLEEGTFSIGLLPVEFSSDEVSRVIRMQTSRKGLTNCDEVYGKYLSALRESNNGTQDGKVSLEDLISKKRNKSNLKQ